MVFLKRVDGNKIYDIGINPNNVVCVFPDQYEGKSKTTILLVGKVTYSILEDFEYVSNLLCEATGSMK